MMYAWVVMENAEGPEKRFRYSLGNDMSLSGEIVYRVSEKQIRLERLAEGASPQATEAFMEALKERLEKGMWVSGRTVRVSYQRETTSLAPHWQMQDQGVFSRFA